jgi:regulator of sigma E protease
MFIEVIRGKPVPPEKEGFVHFIGFVALMILMVFVLYNDIAKIFA